LDDAELSIKAHSGLFQLLPLGLRIQEKIERLLDKHMTEIGVFYLASVHGLAPEFWARSLKGLVVGILLGRVMEEVWKAQGWQI
jgi:hypothetical protein